MSRGILHSIWVGLTRNVAFTAPGAEDDRLTGRTYAIPFEDVWQASRKLLNGGLKRWKLLEADDEEGILRGRVQGRVARGTSTFTVRIILDTNAQTRVDAMSASRIGRADFGMNARRIDRFFRSLDRSLESSRGRAIASARVDPAATRGHRPIRPAAVG